MGTEVITIPRIRKVYYATYANLPTTGLKVGDLGYATDRLVFYRWSGAAWEAITIHSSSGVAADIPAAADLPEGSLYHETDTGKLKQVQAGAWVEISVTPRFGLGQLEWTADKLLKGAGVGANPTEVDPGAAIASGTYTGDSAQNRAIPHGLGVTPKLVVIGGYYATDNKTYGVFVIIDQVARIILSLTPATADGAQEVTAMDATNFYVGGASDAVKSANSSFPYVWAAIG